MSGDKVFHRSVHTLILDDSEGMQQLLAEMLQGCVRGRVAACRTIEKAQAALEADAFDLAIVDREMASEDGLAFVRHVRSKRGMHQHMPIVALSVNTSREMLLEALLSGAHSVLRKPVSRRDLHAHVRRALSEQRTFVQFTSHVLPLSRSLAWQLGGTPQPADVIEALAAAIARTTSPHEGLEAADDAQVTLAPAKLPAQQDSFSLI
jgi:DNA-binding response OmpR family regulator